MIRSSIVTSESIIVLPTAWIALGGRPSRSRFGVASGEWVKSSSAIWSVRIRLISSGIVRSHERRPASMWPTGMFSFDAVSAAASVELTSPGTSTMSGLTSFSSGSSRSITRAVWTACVPEPTSRWWSGATPSWSRKIRDMASS